MYVFYFKAKVTPRWHRWQIFCKTSVARSRIQLVICVCTWVRPLFCFLLSTFQPHWPDILLYSFGHFSVFTRRCKNSSIYNSLQCLPPVSQLLEILGLSELTVMAHLPQTRSLAHTQALKQSNNRVKNKFMTTFCHPQTLWLWAALAWGQTTASWRTVRSCLLSLPHLIHHPLLLCDWRNEGSDSSSWGHPPVAYQP